MYKFIVVFAALLILSECAVFTQDFKPVNTAQDVIDNYITASGGAEAIGEIESIKMKGNIGAEEVKGSIQIYFSKKYVYMDIKTEQFAMIQAIDVEKKKGWLKFGEMIKDMKPEEIEKNTKNVEGSMFGNFLDPKGNKVTFELLQNESVNGSDCYVIDVKKDSSIVQTSYFDIKSFMKVKELKGGFINEFSDFKKVPGTEITMPYRIKSQTGDVVITEIKFNEKFDKKLLVKPKEKEEEK